MASVEIVRVFQVTPRAIRFYEELGLIQTQRDKLNRRCLDPINCKKLKIIVQLRRGGISLFDIGKALELLQPGKEWDFQRFIDDLSRVRVRELNDQITAVELARRDILSPSTAPPPSMTGATAPEERLRPQSGSAHKEVRH